MGPKNKVERKRKSERVIDFKEERGTPTAGEPFEDKTKEKGKKIFKARGRNKYIGAHVSMAGGMWKAVDMSVNIGARSFALFLGCHHKWIKPAIPDKVAARFQEACNLHGFDPSHILPHAPYLMNCGSPKPDVFEKSQAMLVDELSRCSLLGLSQYNMHPGSTVGSTTVQQCQEKIAQAIDHAHRQTPTVVTVLENMSGQGNWVGSRFSELRAIIDHVRDQTRIGVCLDTCHAFAAGYDLSAEGGVNSMLDEFDRVVGLRYLRALHLNDSKGKLGCHLDRHENIGRGQIGLGAFRDIVNDPRLDNIPLILETPGGV